jgi:hypothetical protein
MAKSSINGSAAASAGMIIHHRPCILTASVAQLVRSPCRSEGPPVRCAELLPGQVQADRLEAPRPDGRRFCRRRLRHLREFRVHVGQHPTGNVTERILLNIPRRLPARHVDLRVVITPGIYLSGSALQSAYSVQRLWSAPKEWRQLLG